MTESPQQTRHVLTIDRTLPFDPIAVVGRRWAIWRGPVDGKGLEGEEQQDARSLALTEVRFAEVRFETCLVAGETMITGEQRLCRLRKKNLICGDAKIGQALYEEPGLKTLRWVHDTHGVTWFALLGTELRYQTGGRYSLCLIYKGDLGWEWHVHWLGEARRAGPPALVFTP